MFYTLFILTYNILLSTYLLYMYLPVNHNSLSLIQSLVRYVRTIELQYYISTYSHILILNHKNNTEDIIKSAICSGLIQTNQFFTPNLNCSNKTALDTKEIELFYDETNQIQNETS